MRWIVTEVPTWLVGIVLILGVPAIAVLAKIVIARRSKLLASDKHNEVTGFLVAIVAVVYAVIVGFTIVSLYEASSAANQDVSNEAAALLQVHNGSFVLGQPESTRLNGDVVGYASAVVDHWKSVEAGKQIPQVQTALNDIYSTLAAYTPHTPAQEDYLTQTIADVDNLSEAHISRVLEEQESGSLPLVLWIVIIIASAATMAFTLLFTLEDLRVACLLVGGVAAVLAVNIFVLIELGYPFTGSVAVGPSRFVEVMRIAGGG